MIKVGWVFYSDAHRRNIETIVSLSKDKGTLDELGLGSIRDAFAGKFFPGTTTIQTRAKYFLIVPWLLQDIFKRNEEFSSFKRLLKDEEIRVINALKKTDDKSGLIGKDAGEKLLRFPSSVYWSGLKRFDIIQPDILLSQVGSFYTKEKRRQSFSTKRLTKEDRLSSDFTETKETQHLLCDGLPKYPGIKELVLPLSYKEGYFLRRQLIQSQPNSLFAYILNNNDQGVIDLNNFQELVKYLGVRNPFSEYLSSALLFDKVMKGAYIRYNMKVSEHGGLQNHVEWEDRWAYYLESILKLNLSPNIFDRYFIEFSIAKHPTDFCRNWIRAVIETPRNMRMIDKLIAERERGLKGSHRARLSNPAAAKKAELPIGISPVPNSFDVQYLSYRFNVARQLLDDIFSGLNQGNNEP